MLRSPSSKPRDGRLEAERALDGIDALEKTEMRRWVEAGDGSPEPKPHTRERMKAQQALRVATAKADAAQGKLAELRTKQANIATSLDEIEAQITAAAREVLVGQLTDLAIRYRAAVAQTATLRAQIDAFVYALPGRFQVSDWGPLIR